LLAGFAGAENSPIRHGLTILLKLAGPIVRVWLDGRAGPKMGPATYHSLPMADTR